MAPFIEEETFSRLAFSTFLGASFSQDTHFCKRITEALFRNDTPEKHLNVADFKLIIYFNFKSVMLGPKNCSHAMMHRKVVDATGEKTDCFYCMEDSTGTNVRGSEIGPSFLCFINFFFFWQKKKTNALINNLNSIKYDYIKSFVAHKMDRAKVRSLVP